VEFQKLRSEALKVESTATARFGRGETDAALQDMENFVAKVKATNLDSSKQALLTRPIEARMDRLRILKHQTDFLTKEAKDRRDFQAGMAQEALGKQKKQQEVAALMKSANKLMDEAKYKEAYAQIQKASALEPDDMSVNAALQMAERMYRSAEFRRVKSNQEAWNWENGNEMFDIGRVTGKEPVKFTDDKELLERYKNRSGLKSVGAPRTKTDKEKEIERKLNSVNVDLSFKGTALEDVISHIQTNTAINFDLDRRSLKEENIDPKMPITVTLQNMTLKSALNIVCMQAGLKHMIDNEAIRVTTKKAGRARSEVRSLSVGDLVVPIQNYGTRDEDFSRERLMRMGRPGANNTGNGNTPAGMPRLPGGASVGESSLTSQGGGKLSNTPGGNVSITSPNGTLEKELIRLITTTIRPDSWQQLGGDGTIEYFPIGMAMVINQSPEVIEEVERLLESLRKLQDLEVTIELKVVSLSETFYERIGVDFSMGIRTNGSTTDPRGLSSPPQPISRTGYNGNVIGLQAPGVPTPELDIPIRATSFARAVPPFGGFGNSFADGGLSLGLAFLSELQVQMFLEAAQGDTRTNVMQAPKVTAFNGASAQITVGDFQFFLTGVTVQAVGGQLLFTPNNVPFFIGSANPLPPNTTVQNGVINFQPTQTQTPGLLLFVQPVVTADRRFVRLNIRQEFVNLVSGTQQIPLTTIITPTFDNGGQGQPIPFTQYLQQPRFSNIATDTVVVVPDGGTVVMGGLKWMTEGRNEFGPPVLSKIPYLNRLFKNVAYGREGRTMLLMVTPRIIINREEQERQTGVRDDDDTSARIR
jgi:type II secretory pathway component GspD/PulD (secretin)